MKAKAYLFSALTKLNRTLTSDNTADKGNILGNWSMHRSLVDS